MFSYAVYSYVKEYHNKYGDAPAYEDLISRFGFCKFDTDFFLDAEEVFKQHCNCKIKVDFGRDSYWEWREKVNTESEYSKTLLLAFLAAKSIVGKKQYCRTNYDMLFSRMAGRPSPEYYTPSNGKNKGNSILRLPEHLKPYYLSKNGIKSRAKCENLLEDLKKFHVQSCSGNGVRGFYISTKLTWSQLYYKSMRAPRKKKSRREKRREEKAKKIEMVEEWMKSKGL